MTANPFQDDIDAALEMIAEDGELCSWFKPAPDADDAKPWRDVRDGEPVEYENVSLAFFSPIDLARGSGQFGMFEQGTDVPSYSQIGLMAGGQEFEPEITDWIVRISGKAEIVMLDKVAPNGIAVLWYVAIK